MEGKILEAGEARRIRREEIVSAMGRDRRLTALEATHLYQELSQWITEDPEHDPAKHLGAMSADMSECPQCEAITKLHSLRDFLKVAQ